MSKVPDPKRLISDPDPTLKVIPDPDSTLQVFPDPIPDPSQNLITDKQNLYFQHELTILTLLLSKKLVFCLNFYSVSVPDSNPKFELRIRILQKIADPTVSGSGSNTLLRRPEKQRTANSSSTNEKLQGEQQPSTKTKSQEK